MKEKFINLSGKIDPVRLEALKELDRIVKESDTLFLLIGAYAKELVLEKIYNIDSKRMTLDIVPFGNLKDEKQGNHRLVNNMIAGSIEFDGEFKKKKELVKKLYQGFICF